MKHLNNMLNHLIGVCRSSADGYATAARLLPQTPYAHLLYTMSNERKQHARSLITRMNATRVVRGNVGAPLFGLQRRWLQMRSAIQGNSRLKMVLAACVRNDEVALETYQKALALEMPNTVRATVERQAKEIERSLLRMKALNQAVVAA